ncbi:HD domain-containing phosphohydrolase [Malaciobacter marinus]|uniref:HD domain-containing phosphohydrolase n=1 Tax=Malaciobacter marinus TaxID=505249 RepID=UPI0009A7EF38|nr:HD domain-containing phosphohydrolase [Malaciobacter marinus]SKB32393.1 HD domain-containing protein [Malaciobacter marinus]
MKKKFYIKIRPTISFILVFLIISVISITLLLQYNFSLDLAKNATKDNFSQISEKLEDRLQNLDKRHNDLISILQLYKEIEQTPQKNKRHPLLKLITTALNNNKHIYALYVGHEDNTFYEVINLNINEKLRKKYNANKEERWLIVKIYDKNGTHVRYDEYLNKNLIQIRSIESKTSYRPTSRPWYKEAIKDNSIIRTEPYLFTNLDNFGVTYAKKVTSTKSVIGLDLSLQSLDKFLQKQIHIDKQGIYLIKKDMKIISKAGKNIKDKKIDSTLKEKITKIINTQIAYKSFSMKINDINYFIYFSKIESIYKNKDYLLITVPQDIIMQPYTNRIYYSFLMTLALLSFTIPLIWYSTKILVTPIEKLEEQNNKILRREFTKVEDINTNIKELDELSKSLVNMSKALKEYENKQQELMDSFIKLIASAIDAKSKYTGAHCARVPKLTMLIANKAHQSNEGIFKDFIFKDEDEKRELSIAAWLHDCGKVTTPEYVIDKATKLETIYNRIHEIRTRFEVIYRDMIIQMYKNILDKKDKKEEENLLKEKLNNLQEEYKIVAKANIGSEFMSDEDIEKIKQISKKQWTRYFDNTIGLSKDEESRLDKNKIQTPCKEYLLSDKKEHIIKRNKDDIKDYDKYNFKIDVPKNLYNLGEVYNLSIKKGTLTNEERYKINEHIMMSIIMLEQLPFSDNLKRVPEYAGAHHETLIGTGYPKKLKKQDMSIPARIMAIADIFEALTASDRPYKKAKTLSEAISILSFMVKEEHIDKDIFRLFLSSGAYKEYAQKYLKKEQIDEVDISLYIKS